MSLLEMIMRLHSWNNGNLYSAARWRRTILIILYFLVSGASQAAFLNPSMDKIERCVEPGMITGNDLLNRSTSGSLFFAEAAKDSTSTDSHLMKSFELSGSIGIYPIYKPSIPVLPIDEFILSDNIYLRHPSFFEKIISRIPERVFYEVSIRNRRYIIYREHLEPKIPLICNLPDNHLK